MSLREEPCPVGAYYKVDHYHTECLILSTTGLVKTDVCSLNIVSEH